MHTFAFRPFHMHEESPLKPTVPRATRGVHFRICPSEIPNQLRVQINEMSEKKKNVPSDLCGPHPMIKVSGSSYFQIRTAYRLFQAGSRLGHAYQWNLISTGGCRVRKFVKKVYLVNARKFSQLKLGRNFGNFFVNRALLRSFWLWRRWKFGLQILVDIRSRNRIIHSWR